MNTTIIDNICPICQDSLNSPQLNGIYKTDCGHYYHTNCFVSWCSQSTGDCPLCRESHIYINNMDYKGRISFLINISKNNDSPQYLKKLGNRINKAELKLKEHMNKFKKFKKQNTEFYNQYCKYQKDINKTKKLIMDLEDKLLGVPLLELPPNKLLKTQYVS